MTVLEFLRTADENEIAEFLHGLLWNCECYGDCPLKTVSYIKMDNWFYSCNHECLLEFLHAEVKDK